jgi:hypothetical protein
MNLKELGAQFRARIKEKTEAERRNAANPTNAPSPLQFRKVQVLSKPGNTSSPRLSPYLTVFDPPKEREKQMNSPNPSNRSE